MLIKVEEGVAEKSLKLFVDKYDDDITCHVSMMTKLDQLGESPEVLRVTQLCLKNLKSNLKSFAQQSILFVPKCLIKEYIVKRKLSEYLRLLLMQVFKVAFGEEDSVADLSATTCDFLAKLVEQFHELYSYFDAMYPASDLVRLGVTEIPQIHEL